MLRNYLIVIAFLFVYEPIKNNRIRFNGMFPIDNLGYIPINVKRNFMGDCIEKFGDNGNWRL